jgi:hypothetical protein
MLEILQRVGKWGRDQDKKFIAAIAFAAEKRNSKRRSLQEQAYSKSQSLAPVAALL